MTLAGTQSSAKLNSTTGRAFIHPSTHSSILSTTQPLYPRMSHLLSRLWLEAGVTEAAHCCPCPPEPTDRTAASGAVWTW